MFPLAPANPHDAPVAHPLLEHVVQWLGRRPCIVRMDAASWGLTLITWIHGPLGAIAVIAWNPKRQNKRDGLPPTWEELGKRSSIERFFGRTYLFFLPATSAARRLVCPRHVGCSHIRRPLGRCFGRLAISSSGSDPLSGSRVSSCLGGQRVMKRPHE